MTAYADSFAGIRAAELASMAGAAFDHSRQLTWWRNELAELPKGDYRRKSYRDMVSMFETGIVDLAAAITR